MPIGIGAQGGSTREIAGTNIGSMTQQQSTDSLQQIRMHLSQPGRDSGMLTLHNRTSEGREMVLERRNGMQLWFDHDDERLDDTRDALIGMLKKAGLDEAVDDLNTYLSHQGGRQNRISAREMLEILNRHLPPVKGSSVDELLRLSNTKMSRQLGSGAFGSAYLARIDGQECVLKTFNEPQKLSLKRSGNLNEAMGSYLTPKNQPGYLTEKVHITQPTLYLVSTSNNGKPEYQIVDPHTMRDLVKQASKTFSPVMCHGLVMPKARGTEAFELLYEGEFSEPDKKQFIRSTLQSIKGLNERGFVHRDLKTENSFFDKDTGIATLIDTGMLFKSSENLQKHRGSDYIRGEKVHGTPLFMHPRALQKELHGTETDLYALGIMALEVEHPRALNHLSESIIRWNMAFDGVTRERMLHRLDQEIATVDSQSLRQDLIALRRDLDDPNKLSGFAMKCFDMAGRPPEFWSNREQAQKAYGELLDDPCFRQM